MDPEELVVRGADFPLRTLQDELLNVVPAIPDSTRQVAYLTKKLQESYREIWELRSLPRLRSGEFEKIVDRPNRTKELVNDVLAARSLQDETFGSIRAILTELPTIIEKIKADCPNVDSTKLSEIALNLESFTNQYEDNLAVHDSAIAAQLEHQHRRILFHRTRAWNLRNHRNELTRHLDFEPKGMEYLNVHQAAEFLKFVDLHLSMFRPLWERLESSNLPKDSDDERDAEELRQDESGLHADNVPDWNGAELVAATQDTFALLLEYARAMEKNISKASIRSPSPFGDTECEESLRRQREKTKATEELVKAEQRKCSDMENKIAELDARLALCLAHKARQEQDIRHLKFQIRDEAHEMGVTGAQVDEFKKSMDAMIKYGRKLKRQIKRLKAELKRKNDEVGPADEDPAAKDLDGRSREQLLADEMVLIQKLQTCLDSKNHPSSNVNKPGANPSLDGGQEESGTFEAIVEERDELRHKLAEEKARFEAGEEILDKTTLLKVDSDTFKSYQNLINKLKSEIVSHKISNEKLQKDLQVKTKELKESSDNHKRDQLSLGREQKEAAILKAQIDSLTESKEQLEEELQNCLNSKKHPPADNDESSQNINKLTNEIEILQDKLRNLNGEFQILQKGNVLLKGEVERSKIMIESLEQQKRRILEARVAAKHLPEDREIQISIEKAALEENIKALEREVGGYKLAVSRLQECDDEKVVLQADIEKKSAEIKEKSAVIESLETNLDDLNEHLKILTNKGVAISEKPLVTVLSLLRKKEAELDEIKKEISALESLKSPQTPSPERFKKREETRTRLKLDLVSLSEEVTFILEWYRDNSSGYDGTVANVQFWGDQYNSLMERSKGLRQKLSDMENSTNGLYVEVNLLRKQVKALEQEIEDQKKQHEDHQREIAATRGDDQASQLSDTEDSPTGLNVELDSLRNQVLALEQQVEAQKKQHDVDQREIANTKIDNVEERLKDLQELTDRLRKEITDLNDKLNKCRQETWRERRRRVHREAREASKKRRASLEKRGETPLAKKRRQDPSIREGQKRLEEAGWIRNQDGELVNPLTGTGSLRLRQKALDPTKQQTQPPLTPTPGRPRQKSVNILEPVTEDNEEEASPAEKKRKRKAKKDGDINSVEGSPSKAKKSPKKKSIEEDAPIKE